MSLPWLCKTNISSFIADYPTNIVPDKVIVKGEVRSMAEFSLHAQVDHMIECFLNAATGYSIERDGKTRYPKIENRVEHKYDAYTIAEDDPVCELAQNAARKVGLQSQLVSGMGGTDANHFNNNGIKMLNLGTGTHHAHSKNESIAVSDMTRATELLVHIVTA